ncbi:MAG: hypothetical protein V3U24_05220 [Candidatus Neomarinimicrobiota bacterium]
MDEDGLPDALSSGEFERCKPYIDEVVTDPSSLRQYYQSLLQHIFVQTHVREERDPWLAHPVIPVNAIKNISSLRKDSPSRPLVEFAARIALEAQPSGGVGDWPEVPPEALNQSVFVADLFNALQQGDLEKASEEAARLALISDNKLYVLEILMEACTRKFDTLGLLGYSIFRAAAFCAQIDIGSFILPLLKSAARERIQHIRMSSPEEFDMDAYGWPVLSRGGLEDVVLYAVAHRLWNLESVKQSAFRGGIALWLAEKYGTPTRIPGGGVSHRPNKTSNSASLWDQADPEALAAHLQGARERGDMTWAVDLGEHWFREGIPLNSGHFVALDSLQHLAGVVPDSCLIFLGENLLSLPSQLAK